MFEMPLPQPMLVVSIVICGSQALKRAKKAAKKARAQGQDEDDPGIQLGLAEGSAGEESEGDGSSLSNDDNKEYADPAEREAARQAAARRMKLAARERKQRADPAHAGMKAAQLQPGSAGNGALDIGQLTLADQEAIALRILGAQARR